MLRAVHDRDAYANLVLPALLRERGLHGRDAALATELAYGTLRGTGTYDAVIGACIDRPLDKVDPPVIDALRLGTHQLLATRVPTHAAVSTTVDLVRAGGAASAAGFVNAVLRKVVRFDLLAWVDRLAPAGRTDPLDRLARHLGRMDESVRRFGASESVDVVPTSEVVVRRPGSRGGRQG